MKEYKIACILLIFMVISCQPTPIYLDSASEDKSSHPEEPTIKGRCGDRICDEIERSDVNLCPKDCQEGNDSIEDVIDQGSSYEPPINVFLVLHNDPDMAIDEFTFQADDRDYVRTNEGIDLLIEEAKQHDLQFTILYNGWYPMEALERNDLGQFQSLLGSGHSVGTHAHRLTYDPIDDLWSARLEEVDNYGRPNYDPIIAHQCWEDAYKNISEVLDILNVNDQNKTMCTRAFRFQDEEQLMKEYGFTIAAGDRAEISEKYFGHQVWNPWRPTANDEPGHELGEDLTVSFITLDHLAQIGSYEISHAVNLNIPQMQRRFLMLYTEWLSRVRSGANDKVWTFGFVYHPNYTDRYLEDLKVFLDWLDLYFINKTTPEGFTIAEYSTVEDIYDEFIHWEKDNPGVSSFHYIRDDPYPYTYPVMVTKLENTQHEKHIDLGNGITCFEFSNEDNQIYLLWADKEQTVDFSSQQKGTVSITNMDNQITQYDSEKISVGSEPILIEPL
jgi:hypothetical protein